MTLDRSENTKSEETGTSDTESDIMGIGVSLVLIAVGAILAFATDIQIFGEEGFDVPGIDFSSIDTHAIGIILMVVGGLGLIATTLIFRPRSRTPRGPGDY